MQRARVQYTTTAHLDCAGCLGRYSSELKRVNVFRCPSEDFLDDKESLHADRSWEDQLRCEILVSRKGSPLCRPLPVNISFATETSRFQGLHVYITEKTELLSRNASFPCLVSSKRFLLYDEAEDVSLLTPYIPRYCGHTNNAKATDSSTTQERPNWSGNPVCFRGMTMDLEIPLPHCQEHSDGNWMHFDTIHQNIRIKHSLEVRSFTSFIYTANKGFQFVFSYSKAGTLDCSKVLLFRKVARFPLALRACLACEDNACVPAYS